jgi:hypothetical protein
VDVTRLDDLKSRSEDHDDAKTYTTHITTNIDNERRHNPGPIDSKSQRTECVTINNTIITTKMNAAQMSSQVEDDTSQLTHTYI